MKKVIRAVLIVLLVLVIAAGEFIAWLTVTMALRRHWPRRMQTYVFFRRSTRTHTEVIT